MLGVGIMVKGPMVALLLGGTLLGLAIAERRARWMVRLRPVIGVPTYPAVALLAACGARVAALAARGVQCVPDTIGRDRRGAGARPGGRAVVDWRRA